jgi:hypothetical protein
MSAFKQPVKYQKGKGTLEYSDETPMEKILKIIPHANKLTM